MLLVNRSIEGGRTIATLLFRKCLPALAHLLRKDSNPTTHIQASEGGDASGRANELKFNRDWKEWKATSTPADGHTIQTVMTEVEVILQNSTEVSEY